MVALDPWRGYASALVAPLGHATVVVDHFHAIRLANVVVDQVRRRVQQATLGHRGRKRDPLYRIRKLLLTAAEQLTGRGRTRLRAGLSAGDPTGEVAAAWQGKELLRAIYASDGRTAARAALERFYRWSRSTVPASHSVCSSAPIMTNRAAAETSWVAPLRRSRSARPSSRPPPRPSTTSLCWRTAMLARA